MSGHKRNWAPVIETLSEMHAAACDNTARVRQLRGECESLKTRVAAVATRVAALKIYADTLTSAVQGLTPDDALRMLEAQS